MNTKHYLILMAVASGLMFFVFINSYSDVCLTCGLYEETTKAQECQYGTINNRCMFEDEYYMITEDSKPLENQFYLELNETCTNLDGKIWCNKGG